MLRNKETSPNLAQNNINLGKAELNVAGMVEKTTSLKREIAGQNAINNKIVFNKDLLADGKVSLHQQQGLMPY